MISRIINEIESYLASPMNDAGDSWEQQVMPQVLA